MINLTNYIVDFHKILHLFPHQYHAEAQLTYYIYSDPINHVAIPNGSPYRWRWVALKPRPPPYLGAFRALNHKIMKSRKRDFFVDFG